MNNPLRKICVVTGARSEYGLLAQLIKLISQDSCFKLQLIVTGMHLSPDFDLTFREIEADGIVIDEKIEMLLSSDSAQGITKSMGLGLIGFADAYKRLAPDLVIVLGDRFEIFSAAQAAMIACIPLAHIHGGETTEGAYDEGIRHAITKMATWHFVAAEMYRKRVIQMGEIPGSVFNVGAPGLDGLATQHWLSQQELNHSLGISFDLPLFLVTYHPVTLSLSTSGTLVQNLLDALKQFPEVNIVFTYPNADSDSREIIARINHFVEEFPARAKAFVSLGRQRYLSLMQYATVIIGNSSSGIIEAPFFKKATVNIGDRQKGRLRATSIIDSEENSGSILLSIKKALSPDFQSRLPQTISLYGQGMAGQEIIKRLKGNIPSISKKFFDISHGH